MAAVEISELTVRFGDVVAVDHLSLTVEAGEVVALLGPNGAGKTTTVETLEGFRRPDSGTVRVAGLDPVADHRQLMDRLGVMLQSCRLYNAIRPIEAVRLFASYYARPLEPEALLAKVGLSERAKVAWRRLSGGEQQRLALALAVVGQPEVVILDEPTAGLDIAGRQLVRELVADLRDRGCCVLLTTHELDEAERVADRLAIIDRGELVALGSAAELSAVAAQTNPEVRFAAAPGLPARELAGALGGTVTEVSPGEYRADVAPTPANIAALTAWLAERNITLGDLRAGRQRLEDTFLRLTESGPPKEPS